MTDMQRTALRELIAKHTEEKTVSREVARESLIEEGFYTAAGDLAPEYGGDPVVQKSIAYN